MAFRAITVTLPLLVDALDMKTEAETLRGFKSGEWKEMEVFCKSIPKLSKLISIK